MPELSIVCTLYQSERYIDEFHARSSKVAQALGLSYEIVFVDDGSPDASLARAVALAADDPHVTVVELSRNHGHHRAMLTGLEAARGQYVFLTDVDLEEAPENLQLFWETMHGADELDAVYGEQPSKATSGLRKWLSESFYVIFNALSAVKIRNRELVSRLMTREFVNALLSYKERELFLPALWTDVGFKQRAVEVDKQFNGHSTYTIGRKIRLAVDAITSFSSRPLLFIFFLGLVMSVCSALFIVWLVLLRLFFEVPLLGWTSTLASIYLIGGLVLFSLGIIGIYMSKIFAEVKARPYPIVRRTIRNDIEPT